MWWKWKLFGSGVLMAQNCFLRGLWSGSTDASGRAAAVFLHL